MIRDDADFHASYWRNLMNAFRREYREARPHRPGAGIHRPERVRPYVVRSVGFAK